MQISTNVNNNYRKVNFRKVPYGCEFESAFSQPKNSYQFIAKQKAKTFFLFLRFQFRLEKSCFFFFLFFLKTSEMRNGKGTLLSCGEGIACGTFAGQKQPNFLALSLNFNRTTVDSA